MSEREIVAVFCVVIFLAIVWLAVSSIRRRQNKQNLLGTPRSLGSLSGQIVAKVSAKYVSTVYYDRPLERIVALGLMHRGLAELVVLSDGIEIDRVGEESFAIAADDITEVKRASATIDRGVERGGLLAISWSLGNTLLTTNLRIDEADDTQQLFDMISKLATAGKAK